MSALKQFFSGRRLWLICVAGVAAGLAIHTYGLAVEYAYEQLEARIASATPLAPMLAQDPSSGVSPNCESRRDASRHHHNTRIGAAHVFRVLQLVSLLPTDAKFEQVPVEIQQAMGVQPGSTPVDVCERGLDLVMRVAQAAGAESNTENDSASIRSETAGLITRVLAGQPGAISFYEETVEAGLDGEDPPEEFESERYAAPFRQKVGQAISQDETLRILFHQTGADMRFAGFQGDSSERAEAREVIVGFARSLMLEIDRDADVQEARWWVQVVQGPEQFFMILLFYIAVLVPWVQLYFGGWRGRGGKVEVEVERLLLQLHRERWFIRWMVGAIPSVGFIGTIRGLGDALAKADLIVSVSSRAEQAAAIGDVSITLALAFTTTLVALVLALIAGLIDRMTESIEQSYAIKRGR